MSGFTSILMSNVYIGVCVLCLCLYHIIFIFNILSSGLYQVFFDGTVKGFQAYQLQLLTTTSCVEETEAGGGAN